LSSHGSAILRENPNHTEALYVRGLALYVRGDMEKAEAHFKQALRGDPDHSRSRLQLKAVKRVVREKQAGNAAFKAGRYEEAVTAYTAALDEEVDCPPFNAKLLYNRALCLSKLGRPAQALAGTQPLPSGLHGCRALVFCTLMWLCMCLCMCLCLCLRQCLYRYLCLCLRQCLCR